MTQRCAQLDFASASVDQIKQGLLASGSKMASIAAKVEKTAEGLLAGDVEHSSRLFKDVVVGLDAFLRLLISAQAYLGDKSRVLELYQKQLFEQLEQLDQIRRERDVISLADHLQYQMVPFFVGWDGMCRVLLKSFDESQPAGS